MQIELIDPTTSNSGLVFHTQLNSDLLVCIEPRVEEGEILISIDELYAAVLALKKYKDEKLKTDKLLSQE